MACDRLASLSVRWGVKDLLCVDLPEINALRVAEEHPVSDLLVDSGVVHQGNIAFRH